MIIPSGPVWQRAAREKQWLIYRLVDKGPGRKPGKMPTLPDHPERSFDRATAACLTYAEAKRHAEALGKGYGLGVFDSQQMVVVDLDGVLTPSSEPGGEPEWRHDVLPHPELYLTGETYVEVSASGTGLHILLPREGWPTATYDISNDPIGYHGAAVNFVAITLDHIEGPREVRPAPRLMAHLLPLLQARIAEREREVQEASGQGDPETAWFPHLTPEERVEATRELLAHLPKVWVVERELWLKVTFALHGYPELFEVWDAWCKTGGAYDAAENEETWTRGDRGEGALTTVGTLIAVAREGGADLSRWVGRGAAGRAQERMQRLAERMPPHMWAEAAEIVAEAARNRFLTPAELLVDGLANVIRYEPSLRFMHLGVLSTLTSSSKGTLLEATLGVMYPGLLRPVTEDEPRPPRVAEEIARLCHKTMQGPIADPRVPYGAVYPERRGAQDFVLVNKLRLRELDASASAEASHWALQGWQQVLGQVFPLPRERAYVEQWVACKAQRPWERMVAILSVATTYGTGRGVFTDLLAALFGRANCSHVTVEDIGGATAQWNDFLLSLLVFVDEMTTGDATGIKSIGAKRRRGYELLKEIVDPREGISRRINVKGGEAYQAVSFSSFFIATNHEDGLPIPDSDRRFSVLQGNDERASEELYRIVQRLIGSEEALAVIWSHLHRVSLEGFNPAVALATQAKDAMVEAGKTDLDVELEGLLEALGWPLLVTNQLVEKLAAAKGELGRAMHRNGTLTPAVHRWVADNSRPLAGDAIKGSRRLRVAGSQQRVRVLRQGEVGMKRATVDGLTNEQAVKWLEALDADTLSLDLAAATRCRGLRAGLRVVK